MTKNYEIYLFSLLIILSGCEDRISNEILKKELAAAKEKGTHQNLITHLGEKDFVQVQDVEEARIICDSIAQLFGRGALAEGFEIIKTYSILPDKDTDTLLESTVNQLDLLSHRFGKACGYEFIAKDEINASLVDFKYMIKCEFYPLIWKFRFYRAKEHWVLNHYEWSDQL